MLVFVIYNSEDLRDPEALDSLSKRAHINDRDFTVRVVRC